jgi:hypothetical protein
VPTLSPAALRVLQARTRAKPTAERAAALQKKRAALQTAFDAHKAARLKMRQGAGTGGPRRAPRPGLGARSPLADLAGKKGPLTRMDTKRIRFAASRRTGPITAPGPVRGAGPLQIRRGGKLTPATGGNPLRLRR